MKLKLLKIKSIKKVGVRNTYDLKVFKNNNFFANNMLVHNSGKSVLTNSYGWQLKRFKNYKVIYVTEKIKSPLENCFCFFPPEETYHLKLLNNYGINSKRIGELTEKIEIYHPFTFNAEFKNLPPFFNFFTFPIKELDSESFSSLTGMKLDSPAIKICDATADKISEDDDLYFFLNKVYKDVKEEENEVSFSRDPKDMGIPVPLLGRRSDVETIKNAFSTISKDYCLHDKKEPLNLDLIKILNDQKTTTFFTTKWITKERNKFFIYIELLKKIDEAIASGKCKYPVLLVLEEIKILLPKTAELSYQKVLTELLRRMLSGLRSQGKGVTVVATTQSYYETNFEFRDACDEILLMKLSAEDRKSVARDFQITRDNFNSLNNIRTGRFVLFNQLIKADESAPIFKAFMTPFAHAEERYSDFLSYYRKKGYELNDKNDIKLYMEKKQKTLFNEQLKRLDKYQSEMNKKRTKISLEKEEINNEKSKIEESKNENSYKLTLQHPELSWQKRANLSSYFKSARPLQKSAVSWAIKIKDFYFIKKYSQKMFVSKEFPDMFEQIYADKKKKEPIINEDEVEETEELKEEGEYIDTAEENIVPKMKGQELQEEYKNEESDF